MSKTVANPIAIICEIEDERTGAVAAYHVIEYVGTDYKYRAATATVNGYVSKKAYEQGKTPLSTHSLNVEFADAEPTRAWLYAKAVEDGNGSVFAGAELVEG